MHLGLICTILISGALQEEVPKEEPPKSGAVFPDPSSDIPGPFPVYNVTGKNATRFHGMVSEHGLNPVVMVLVKSVEENAAILPFLQKLNARIVFNRESRVAGFVVFHPEQLKDLITDDDIIESLEAEIKKLDQGLTDVVLGLTPQARVEKYLQKDPNAAITVVIYDRLSTVSVHTFPSKAAFNGDVILDEIATKFGAKRETDN